MEEENDEGIHTDDTCPECEYLEEVWFIPWFRNNFKFWDCVLNHPTKHELHNYRDIITFCHSFERLHTFVKNHPTPKESLEKDFYELHLFKDLAEVYHIPLKLDPSIFLMQKDEMGIHYTKTVNGKSYVNLEGYHKLHCGK